MALEVRTINATDPDAEQQLDDCHQLSVESYKPKWACDSVPYPSRNQFTEMMNRDGHHFITCRDDTGLLVGWYYHDSIGHIMGGTNRHGPNEGTGNGFDEYSLPIHKAMQDEIRRNCDGKVYHCSWSNPRLWYAMQVQCGLPPSPLERFAHFAAQEPPEPISHPGD